MTQVKLKINRSSYLQSLNWLLKSKAPLCGCITTSVRSRLWSGSDHHSDPSSAQGNLIQKLRQDYGSCQSITEDFALEAALHGRTPPICRMLSKWILLFHAKEKGASVYVNKQYEGKGQDWSFKLWSLTEHWKGFLGHPEQTISCPSHPTGCQLGLTTCGLAGRRAQTESLAPGKARKEVAQQHSAAYPQQLWPLCIAAQRWEEQWRPDLLLYTPAFGRLWHHPLMQVTFWMWIFFSCFYPALPRANT